MKKIILLCALLVLPLISNAESTGSKTIERIQIYGNNAAAKTNYYFYNNSGWNAPSCPSAVYAFLRHDDAGAKEMLTLAIEAKKAGTTVQFIGGCQGQTHFKVNYMFFQ